MLVSSSHLRVPLSAISSGITGSLPTDLRCFAFLSLIRSFENYQIKFRKRKNFDGFCSISSTWGKDLLSKKLNYFVKPLEDAGFIEVNHRFKIGRYCKQYRLTEKARNDTWVSRTEEELFPIEKRSKSTNKGGACVMHVSPWGRIAAALNDPKNLPDGDMKELLLWVEKNVKEVDLFECEELEETIVKRGERSYEDYQKARAKSKESRIKKGKPELPNLTKDYFIEGERHQVDSIRNKDANVSLDKNNGRVYHSIANLSKDYRKFLRHKGHKLVNVDVKTCQPCLLASFYGESETEKEEKARFVKFVTDKDYYSELGSVVNIQLRAKCKTQSMLVMFGRLIHQNCAIGKAFSILFPVLAGILNEIRRFNYKDIAYKMQKMESTIMIQGALADFQRLHPEKFAVPIHDSFLIHEDDTPLVSELIARHFRLQMGFLPVLRIEGQSDRAA